MDELKLKLSTNFNEIAYYFMGQSKRGSEMELPKNDIAKRTDQFMRDLAAYINATKVAEIKVADEKLKGEYGEDWLTYRDDRLRELKQEAGAIKSNFTWNKAQTMAPMERLRGIGIDARANLRVPVPGEGRIAMDGEVRSEEPSDTVS